MAERVVFLHPDLGIGGAERLILDAAFALHSADYEIKVVTNHHDAEHCFADSLHPELNLKVAGSWFPRTLCGAFVALCAYIRFLLATFYLLVTCNNSRDVVFVDQIPIALPLLSLFGYKTFFYCHFPDQLLTERKSWIKWFYRLPIDWIEQWSIGWASVIAVNSEFTAGVFHKTFKRLRNVEPEIVYPIANAANLNLPLAAISPVSEGGVYANQKLSRELLPSVLRLPADLDFLFVSINRYERKKNLSLSIHALKQLVDHWDKLVKAGSPRQSDPSRVHLVIAGGYDKRLTENVQYHNELVKLAQQLGVDKQVTFIRSFSSEVKALLISASDAIVYTPAGEHFGIVPVESMLLSRPVIGLNSGGPRETVIDGTTGFLCSVDGREPTGSKEDQTLLAVCMAEKFAHIINNPDVVAEYGAAGYSRAIRHFSFASLTEHLKILISRLFSATE